MSERSRLWVATLLVGGLGVGFWSAAFNQSDGAEIDAAAAAMRAWGSFAGTGDLGSVSDWFAADGPQYRQLQAEAGAIVPGDTYDFELADAEVIGPGLVRGSVSVTSDRGSPQLYRWDIELVKEAGDWKVWTVRTSPENPET